jgi:hypothetical protein
MARQRYRCTCLGSWHRTATACSATVLVRHDALVAWRLDKRRLIVSFLVTVGLGSIVYGFASAQTGNDCISDKASIERIEPGCGDQILRQSEVGADLKAGLTGTLTIDGVMVPTFDVNTATPSDADRLKAQYDQGTGTILYTPRPGAVIEEFSPGQHTIVLTYGPLDQPDTRHTFTWNFTVL